ncbi:MAG: hypothetical protein COA86_15465 [Kangiella sp.]|nr:MAG: hypothetical protein COA86_15465 [Kangiella sp.]
MNILSSREQNNLSQILLVGLISITLMFGSGCGGLDTKRLKKMGAIAAIGLAAKLIYDMVVNYQSKLINDEDKVIEKYKLAHGKLPEEPVVVAYESSIQAGNIVTAGNDITILSRLEVVRGASTPTLTIEEKITIYDNENKNKELKSFIKVVNSKTNASGTFENEFIFQLPMGMPQGIYPIRTVILVNGKAYIPVDNQMQLVQIKQNNTLEMIVSL